MRVSGKMLLINI